MEVIKLGGSLYGAENLKNWLNVLSDYAKQQTLILVPGGGPFADQVRHAQRVYGFDDITAHQMAILAMQQFGRLLQSLCPAAQPFEYPSSQPPIVNMLNIWLPNETLFTVPEIETSWRVTSDTLALWLSQSLNATHLTLVKSAEISYTQLDKLSQSGIIDEAFPIYFKKQPINTSLVSTHFYNQFEQHRQLIMR